MRSLLIGVSEFDQMRFAPGPTQEFHADWQPISCKATGDDNRRQAGVGANPAICPRLSLTDRVGFTTNGWIGERVEIVLRHRVQKRFPERVAHSSVLEIL